MAFDDAVDHGKAQTGALTEGFGGVKRLENPGKHLFLHPQAGVGDVKSHVGTFLGFRVPGAEGIIEFDGSGPDLQLAPFRHRIAGIDAEVHDDLFQPGRISLDDRQVLVKIQGHPDLTGEGAAKQFDDIVDMDVERNRQHLFHILPGKGKELMHQLRGAKACFFNGLQYV